MYFLNKIINNLLLTIDKAKFIVMHCCKPWPNCTSEFLLFVHLCNKLFEIKVYNLLNVDCPFFILSDSNNDKICLCPYNQITTHFVCYV